MGLSGQSYSDANWASIGLRSASYSIYFLFARAQDGIQK